MVDDQGYLILSPTRTDVVSLLLTICLHHHLYTQRLTDYFQTQNSRSTTKRYHLSEFRMPYMPDHDRQELPNSTSPSRLNLYCSVKLTLSGVLLDFCDGTTLQLACENISGQTKVLRSESHTRPTQDSLCVDP